MRFSVVVPTYQRCELVLACVRSLTRQQLVGDFEIIVVVDGSTDGTAESLRRLKSEVPLIVIEQVNRGLSAARNAGATIARGELLLFLDDDMEADTRLLAEHDREHGDRQAMVLGHIPIHPDSPRNFLSDAVSDWANERRQRMSRSDASLLWQDWVMGQSSIPRKLFFDLGCFDDKFTRGGSYGNEDLEFCYRAYRAGVPILFNDNAISWQKYIVTPQAHLKQWFESGSADVHFVRKHPELIDKIFPHGMRHRWLSSILYRPLRWLSLASISLFIGSRLAQRLFFSIRAMSYARGVEAAGCMPRPRPLQILCYHAIADLSGSVLEPYGIHPDRFRAQIGALQGSGYHFITVGEFLRFINDGAGLPKRALLLTFDDCYQSLHDAGLPVLKALAVPAIAFAVSRKIGATNDWDAHLGAPTLALADAAALMELEFAGVLIGAHSCTHRNLRSLSDDELGREVNQSIEDLRASGLEETTLFAYPYGEHDQRVRNAVQVAGYDAAMTTETGIVGLRPNRYRLPRVEVMAADSAWRLRFRLDRARWRASLARRPRSKDRPTPRVSIVIPAFNAAATLDATVASVHGQTCAAWDAIIVDDGSTDATGQVAGAWSNKDSRIRLIRRENGGEAAARNTGMAAASGDWLVFLDSDDWIAPEYLDRLLAKAATNPSLDAVVCGCARVSPAGSFVTQSVYGPTDLRDPFPKFVRNCPLAIHNCMIRRSTAIAIGGFDETLKTCADWDFWQRVARAGTRFGTVPEVLALYRIRAGSSSTNAAQVLADGLTVIRRGYAKDPRVPDAQPPEFSDGLDSDDLGETLFRHALWPASILIANGESPHPVLQYLVGVRAPSLQPEMVGEELFHNIPLAAGQSPCSWPDRFPVLQQQISKFLAALEQGSGAGGLAEAAGRDLERRILESASIKDRILVGASCGVLLELHQPIDAIDAGPGIRQIVLVVTAHAHTVGAVALRAGSTALKPAEIADAVVEHLAWPIMRTYLRLQIPADSPLSFELKSLARESKMLQFLRGLIRCGYQLLSWQKKNGALTNPAVLREMLGMTIGLNPLSLMWRACTVSPDERSSLVTDALTIASKKRVRNLFDSLAIQS